MLKWADECAKENDATFLSLTVMSANVRGVQLYERKGYVATKDPDAGCCRWAGIWFCAGNKYCSTVYMVKQLP